MSVLTFGAHADVVLLAGQVLRVSTQGIAVVRVDYGAPAGSTTVDANTRDFGPYSVPSKLTVTATAGSTNYSLVTTEPRAASALPEAVPFATAVPFDAYRYSDPVVQTTALAFTVGATGRGQYEVQLTTSGVHAVTFTGIAYLGKAGEDIDATVAGVWELYFVCTAGGTYGYYVRNVSGNSGDDDEDAPVMGTPSIANAAPTKLVFPFDEAPATKPAANQIILTNSDGIARTVTATAIVGNSIEATLSAAAVFGITIGYTIVANTISDASGNYITGPLNGNATNNVQAPAASISNATLFTPSEPINLTATGPAGWRQTLNEIHQRFAYQKGDRISWSMFGTPSGNASGYGYPLGYTDGDGHSLNPPATHTNDDARAAVNAGQAGSIYGYAWLIDVGAGQFTVDIYLGSDGTSTLHADIVEADGSTVVTSMTPVSGINGSKAYRMTFNVGASVRKLRISLRSGSAEVTTEEGTETIIEGNAPYMFSQAVAVRSGSV